MMRSMYASVSGLKVHQQKMDIIGNNISNVNTVGYKGSRASFSEMLTQTIKGASSPGDDKGGTNPQQIGLGVNLGSVDNDMGSGNLQPTGKKTDVALQGDGFFIVNNGEEDLYTRAGSFSFDSQGFLSSSLNGNRVQGWMLPSGGDFDTSTDPTNIDLSKWLKGQPMPAKASENISYSGNLDASIRNEIILESDKITVEDGVSGTTDKVSITLSQTDNFNQWKFELSAEDTASTFTNGTGYITLDKNGVVTTVNTAKDGTGTDLAGAGNGPVIDIAGAGDTVELTMPSSGDDISSVPLFKGAEALGNEISCSYNDNTERKISADVFDSLGEKHTVNIKVEKTDINNWIIKESNITVDNNTVTNAFGGTDPKIVFNEDGSVKDTGETPLLSFQPTNGATNIEVNLDFSNLTQFSGGMTADFNQVDGYTKGYFQSISINQDGTINGSFDNGQNKMLSKLAVAKFSNPEGLIKEGGVFKTSNNSGQPKIDAAGINGRGKLAPSTLEMSNVDLAEQFTEMITAQRGFQASSKMISTASEMLQELVNLKR